MPDQKEKDKDIFCPYCDEQTVKEDVTGCQPCGVTVFYCPQCRKPAPRENRLCPHCGAEIRG